MKTQSLFEKHAKITTVFPLCWVTAWLPNLGYI